MGLFPEDMRARTGANTGGLVAFCVTGFFRETGGGGSSSPIRADLISGPWFSLLCYLGLEGMKLPAAPHVESSWDFCGQARPSPLAEGPESQVPPEHRLRVFHPPPHPQTHTYTDTLSLSLCGSQWLASSLAFSEGSSSGKDYLSAASLHWLVSGLSANTS